MLRDLLSRALATRGVFYSILGAIYAALVALVKPWDLPLEALGFGAKSTRLYGPQEANQLLCLLLLVPVSVLVADLAANRISRWFTGGDGSRPLVLGTEALFLLQPLLFLVVGAALTATFGEWPRPWVLGALAMYTAAQLCVARELGKLGVALAALPYIIVGEFWSVVIPRGTAVAAALVAAGAALIVSSRVPEMDSRATTLRISAGFLLAALLTTGSAFSLLNYGLALGLNMVPAIESWSYGCFTRMERGCLATLALLPGDPVSRAFLAEVRLQQGRVPEARDLAHSVLSSGATGSAGMLAQKLLRRLDLQDAVRSELASQPETGTGACAAVFPLVREVQSMLDRASVSASAMGAPEEYLAAQYLDQVREAARAAPGCVHAQSLLRRIAYTMSSRVKNYEKSPRYHPLPEDPTSADFEKLAAGDPVM